MTNAELEKRISVVEGELAQLKAQLRAAPPRSGNWVEEIAGTFANDPLFDEAMRLGRKWRTAQRPKASRGKQDSARAKRNGHK